MKVVVVGTRGIPNILGGVETHCEELYPRLAAMGHDITIIRRTPYVNEQPPLNEYKGVKLCDVYAPRKKSIEAITHTFLGVLKARSLNPDIVHFHTIGPSLLVPLARLLGMKVVMTHHGPDYDRAKWGKMAKRVLRLSERVSARWSNKIIVISEVIANILSSKYGRTDTTLIYNGVNMPTKSQSRDYLKSLGIGPDDKYVLTIGRFVKEKGFHDLIEAFSRAKVPGYKLVIAGDSDHQDHYSTQLKEQARQHGVVLTGFIKGEKLNEVMSHATLFVLPSYHEGLPIALLEAMSYNLDAIVSDIPANKISALDAADFFPVGNVDALAARLKEKLAAPATPRTYNLTPYDWDHIATQTSELYNSFKK
ncbi:MAG: glycosyltransferase family 4 protein [Bacteroidales bacterium]|nr:glycosyltransferase family 4 protein [Bacteroidales bacterium]